MCPPLDVMSLATLKVLLGQNNLISVFYDYFFYEMLAEVKLLVVITGGTSRRHTVCDMSIVQIEIIQIFFFCGRLSLVVLQGIINPEARLFHQQQKMLCKIPDCYISTFLLVRG